MTRLFKKLDIAGVAVLMLAFFVAVGFKATEQVNPSGWYAVEIDGNPAEPADQKIGSHLPDGLTGDCDPANLATICAIYLVIEQGADLPENVAEAETMEDDDEGISIGPRAFDLN